jgi:hypothetical protein
MKCPHCSISVHITFVIKELIHAIDEKNSKIGWEASFANCPHCGQAVIFLQSGMLGRNNQGGKFINGVRDRFLVWPMSSLRPCPSEVPTDVATDFKEASSVLSISPQASAALTRRTLQQILRDYGHTKSKDLFDQIQEVIDAGQVSSALADQLNAVRVIGNFAAHPLKSQVTGAILPVEPNEAEWNLDVLEDVFDHYFVKPAKVAERKTALNLKLAAAGKPQLP